MAIAASKDQAIKEEGTHTQPRREEVNMIDDIRLNRDGHGIQGEQDQSMFAREWEVIVDLSNMFRLVESHGGSGRYPG